MKRRSLPPRRISALHRAVLLWYRRNGRELDWRRTSDPYRILLSEIMLQQTQVARVREKYPAFLSLFPSFRTLAKAGRSEVIRAWRGMGYNNRSVRLHQLARAVTSERGGRLPSDPAALQQLPGIGPYTAHAVACFAFGRRVPVVDTNIRRVLSRWVGSPVSVKELWSLAEALLPTRSVQNWNQALMDLGATVCVARTPDCSHCPATTLCPSAHRVPHRTKAPRGREPRHRGFPNRIYRGRIVELLRQERRGRGLTLKTIGNAVLPTFRHNDIRWLRSILHALERDGILQLRSRGGTLSARLTS